MARIEHNRIVKLLGAGAYGQIVTLIYQMGLIPITIGVWGAPLAADWVIVTSLAAYLSFSDFGFSMAAGNRMCHAAAANDWSEVSRIYRCSLALTLTATFGLVAIFALGFVIWPVQQFLKLTSLSVSDFNSILICQAVLVMLAQLTGAECNLYRACSKAAFAAMLATSSRLVEFFVAAGSILLGAGLLQVSIITVFTRAVLYAIIYIISLREFTEITRWARSFLDGNLLRELWMPSIGFMAFPVAFAFGNQFLLTAIAATGGPILALAFSTCRTLTRVIYQAGGLLAGATAVNFTFAFGKRDISEMQLLFRSTLNLCFWGATAGSIFLALAGPAIYGLWTHGEIPFDHVVFFLLLVDAILAALWFSAMAAVGSANQHSVSAWLFASLNALVVGLSFVVIPHGGLKALSALILAIDLILVFIVVGKGCQVCRDRPWPLLVAVCNPFNLITNSRYLLKR